MATNLISNLKDILIPFLSAIGIKILTGNSDYIQVEIELNSIGFYLIITFLSMVSILSLSKIRVRVKRMYSKMQAKHTEEIKKQCKDDIKK